jgi:hypothetical protein
MINGSIPYQEVDIGLYMSVSCENRGDKVRISSNSLIDRKGTY